jgi:CBS domain containing-hemolysin-like protein
MEAVLLSVTPSFVAGTVQKRGGLGRKLRALKDQVDQPLAAILSLNTIAHTVGAAGAGAQAAIVFGDAYVGVFSGVLTFLILVLSEIIPKTVGALYWRRLTPLMVPVIAATIWAMWPLVKLAEGLTRLLARGKKKVLLHRGEFIALAELGAEEGVLHDDESRILRSLFRFRQVLARDIMTPRTVVFSVPQNSTVSETVAAHPDLRFSRIPVYGKDREDISGFVLKSDVLLRAARLEGETRLSELMRPITVAPGILPLHEVFARLLKERAQLALVVDEYGGMEGLLTMEDVIETLLGLEIVDEGDAVQDMQELAREQWLRRARRLGIVSEGTDPNHAQKGGEDPDGI